MKPIIVCGIELELEYDASIFGLNPAPYHHHFDDKKSYHWVGNYFISETDGSLAPVKFSAGRTVELVSVPFSIDDWEKVLLDFKEYVLHNSDCTRLSDVICFNDTTGAHLHLSLLNPEKGGRSSIYLRKNISKSFKGKPMFFRDVVNVRVLKSIKAKLLDAVEKEMPDVFELWHLSLVRSYARGLNEQNIYFERAQEWNLTLKDNIEYRGFHLRGIKTWEDFMRIYRILFACVKDTINEEFETDKPFYMEENLEGLNPSLHSSLSILKDDVSKDDGYDSICVDESLSDLSVVILLPSEHRRRSYDVVPRNIALKSKEELIKLKEANNVPY